MVESTPLADARGHAPPLSVTGIERVPAPPPDVFVREYLRPRRPVVLTGLTADWLPAATWTDCVALAPAWFRFTLACCPM